MLHTSLHTFLLPPFQHPMPKVSQQYIAKQLGICRTTVSRCFSRRSKIAPDTRAKVLELAAQLGYHYKPQRSDRCQDERQVSEISVFIGVRAEFREMPLPSQSILKGTSDRAASLEIPLNVRYLDPVELDELIATNRTPRGLRSGEQNGAILVFPFTPTTVEKLSQNLPTVCIAEDYPDAGVDSIDVDHHGGIYKIVSHLASLGHRRIGFLTWRYTVENPWVFRRFGAYVDSLFRLGLEFDPDLTLNIRNLENYQPTELAEEVAKRIRSGTTAWVCAADHQAYRLIADLRQHAIRVPEDCSVTGFDGIEPPPGMPRLTSLRVPFEEMGATSVARLLDRIQNPSAHRRHNLVEGHMVKGQTTLPCSQPKVSGPGGSLERKSTFR